MDRPSPLLLLVLLVLGGLILWGSLRDRVPSGGDRGVLEALRLDPHREAAGGSLVPCDVPLRWRVADPDPRFGLDAVEVAQAVADAAGIWQGSVGRILFQHDPVDGFPIRLIFDDRQRHSRERRRIQADIDGRAASLESRRHALEDRQRSLARDREEHGQRLEDFLGRLAEHNERVAAWNAGDGGSALEQRRLREAEAELESERRRIDRMARDLDRRQEGLQSEADRFNRDVSEFNRVVESAESDAMPPEVESGVYREEVEEANGRITRVTREIRVYQFVNRNHLVLVLAHELGHALGLPHLDASEAIMAESPDPAHLAETPLRVSSADLQGLRERCPEL